MTAMSDTAFDSAPQSKKNLRVYLVNPPSGDDPWRTRQDYIDDQSRNQEIFRMMQESQRKMSWSFRLNLFPALIAVLSMAATTISSFVTLRSYAEESQKQSIIVNAAALQSIDKSVPQKTN